MGGGGTAMNMGLVIAMRLVAALAGPLAAAPAQERSEQERPETDRLEEMNIHDYFVAEDRQDTKLLLWNVNEGHTKKVMTLVSVGRTANAAEEISYILARFPNHPDALLLAGLLAAVLKRPDLPVTYYERALELYPQYAVTWAQYGDYLVKIGRTANGIQKLEEATKIDPTFAAAYGWLARAYLRTGNREASRRAAERATELGYTGKIE
jgi:predicted Zn-dependent protease